MKIKYNNSIINKTIHNTNFLGHKQYYLSLYNKINLNQLETNDSFCFIVIKTFPCLYMKILVKKNTFLEIKDDWYYKSYIKINSYNNNNNLIKSIDLSLLKKTFILNIFNYLQIPYTPLSFNLDDL